MISWITGSFKSSARVVDGALIVSIPDSVTPIVWRVSYDEAKTAKFEVDKKGDEYLLIFKKNGGKAETVATFNRRGPAVEVLFNLTKAIEQSGASRSMNAGVSFPEPTRSKTKSLLSFIFGTVFRTLIVLMTLYIVYMVAGRSMMNLQTPTVQKSLVQSSSSPTGQAVDADEYLR